MTPLRTSHDVTQDVCSYALAALSGPGVAYLQIDEGYGSRRVVLAAMPDSSEIMVAMEGQGCVFIDRTTEINPFMFIKGGFQLTAATILTKVFYGFTSQWPASIPQLTHQNRS